MKDKRVEYPEIIRANPPFFLAVAVVTVVMVTGK